MRSKINHTSIHSGVWLKYLERLTSPVNAVKELKAQAGKIRYKVVSKKFNLKEIVK